MIIFVNLKEMVEGEDNFAFYDSTSSKIVTLAGENVWDRLEHFESDYKSHYQETTPKLSARPLERFTGKIPKDYFREEKKTASSRTVVHTIKTGENIENN